MPFNWPVNDSPFWKLARTGLLLTAVLIAGFWIYEEADFVKDFKMLMSIAAADGALSVVDLFRKKKSGDV